MLLDNTLNLFLDPFIPSFLMVLVGIVIIKHQFLDIKPVIVQAVSYVVLLTLLLLGFILVLFFCFR